MTRYGTLSACLVSVVAAGLLTPEASAQTSGTPQVPAINTGFPASANVGGGLSARSPGAMVQAGIARAQGNYNITATAPTTTPRKTLLIAAITASFAALDQAITFFTDLLFRRAGWEPPSTTNGSTVGSTDGTTDRSTGTGADGTATGTNDGTATARTR